MSIRIPRGEFDLRDDSVGLQVRIEIAVVRQLLKPGESVPLESLRDRFSCGDKELREALGVLDRGGLVRLVGETIHVPVLEPGDLDRLLDERSALEKRMIRRVVERLGEADRKQLQHLIRYAHMAAVVGDLEIMVKHDSGIDDLMASVCDEPDLALRSRTVKSLIRRIWAHTQSYLDLVPMMELRRKAIEAVASGDVAAAEACALDVVEAVRRLLAPAVRGAS